jgi:two-component system OmpR family response regulator
MPLKVLHVEDEPEISEITAIAFRRDGRTELMSANSGEQALHLLETGYSPDVILLDVMMPGLDGPETLRRIRGLPSHSQTPVIFVTARTQRHEKQRYLELGALGVITKPFNASIISQQVRAILSGEGG